MLLESRIGAPPPAGPADPRIIVVPIEQVLPARIRNPAQLIHESRKLRVGHGAAIDPERRERDRMGWPFIGKSMIAAHDEGAACDPHHVRLCGGGSGRSYRRERSDQGCSPDEAKRNPSNWSSMRLRSMRATWQGLQRVRRQHEEAPPKQVREMKSRRLSV
jgi:hypothetical protein